jgi:ribosomal protein S18 acetylase RimI-like enzyme
MSSWIVRPAIELDAAGVARLCVEVNPFAYTGGSSTVEFYQRIFSDACKNDDELLVVAQTESAIVGFVYAVIEHASDDCAKAPFASLEIIGVKSSYRRQGIARGLMGEVESWAKAKEMKIIQLAVAEDNQAAIKLNQSLGYRTVMRKMQKEL